MTTCKRSESSESDLQDYVITGCSSAISLKRELSCYALATLNDWGDSVARLSDWGDSVARLTSDMTELHVNQGDKKASWDHNVELACSLEEINDSFGGCISAIASRIAFASGDDEEMFEYMKEQSVSSLQSELHDVDGVGLVDAVKSLNLSSSAPKNGNNEPRPNCSFKQ